MSGYILLAVRIGIAVALYAFLGWAIFTLWKTLNSQARAAAKTSFPRLALVPVGASLTSRYDISAHDAIIGRDPTCSLCLDDITISGQHARVYFEMKQWWLQDLASTNGTYLNDELVTDPVVLAEGDRLRFGKVDFQVSMIKPTP